MSAKLSRKIAEFKHEPTFSLDDTVADFKGRPDITLYRPVDYEGLFAAYGIEPTDFTEKVATLANPEALEQNQGEPLVLNWVTSVDVLAANQGVVESNSFNQLAALGVVTTKDNQVVIGVRGGKVTEQRREQYGSGKYGPAVAGSIRFQDAYREGPITDTLMDELYDELGKVQVTSLEQLGAMEAFRPGPTGIKFVGQMATDATLAQLQELNTQGNKMYKAAIEAGATHNQAVMEVDAAGLPKDSWEHSKLIGLDKDAESIKRIATFGPMTGIGQGALMLYADKI